MLIKLHPYQIDAMRAVVKALGSTEVPLAERSIDEIEPTGPSIADLQAKGYLHTMQAHGRVLRGNIARSVSDDDLCATCANCHYRPGELSTCCEGWPTIINPDGYITECDQHQPRP